MAAISNNGVVSKPSKYSVEETLERLKRTLEAKGYGLRAGGPFR